jgi:hypothetical protein
VEDEILKGLVYFFITVLPNSDLQHAITAQHKRNVVHASTLSNTDLVEWCKHYSLRQAEKTCQICLIHMCN